MIIKLPFMNLTITAWVDTDVRISLFIHSLNIHSWINIGTIDHKKHATTTRRTKKRRQTHWTCSMMDSVSKFPLLSPRVIRRVRHGNAGNVILKSTRILGSLDISTTISCCTVYLRHLYVSDTTKTRASRAPHRDTAGSRAEQNTPSNRRHSHRYRLFNRFE